MNLTVWGESSLKAIAMKLYNATNENAMHVTTKAPKVCDVKPDTNCPQRSRGSTCVLW